MLVTPRAERVACGAAAGTRVCSCNWEKRLTFPSSLHHFYPPTGMSDSFVVPVGLMQIRSFLSPSILSCDNDTNRISAERWVYRNIPTVIVGSMKSLKGISPSSSFILCINMYCVDQWPKTLNKPYQSIALQQSWPKASGIKICSVYKH